MSKETQRRIRKVVERVPVVDGLPLRLSLEPDAIREHFEYSDRVQSLSDEQLMDIGAIALCDDRLYRGFNLALRAAILRNEGFDPDLIEVQNDGTT